jgi:hypothetical protein
VVKITLLFENHSFPGFVAYSYWYSSARTHVHSYCTMVPWYTCIAISSRAIVKQYYEVHVYHRYSYSSKKTKTYSDQANFVPFIVETGGRINAAGLQFLSREAEGTAGLMDVLHCVASHGHWRFNRATCLHRLPRRYTRLIARAQGTGEGAIAMIRTWVSKSTMMTRLRAKVPFPVRAQVCVFLSC